MPELPEVETIARGLAKRVIGDVIESVWLGQKPEPLKSPAHEMAATLERSRIAAVRRIGKHIVFDLEPNRVAGVARAPLRQAQGRLSPATVAPASCRRRASCRGALAPKHLASSTAQFGARSSVVRKIRPIYNPSRPSLSGPFGGK